MGEAVGGIECQLVVIMTEHITFIFRLPEGRKDLRQHTVDYSQRRLHGDADVSSYVRPLIQTTGYLRDANT